jgi:glycosyltransferase involved in cell wall biosynthesis
MTNIKISAILPNYNSSEFLAKSIETLARQTEAFHDIVIVDDGSTDNSLDIIHAFMNEYENIRLIRHEKNQGVNAALNTGIQHAEGDYVILCAADDYYGENIVALAKKVIQKYPAVGLVCGDAVVYRYDLKEPFYRMLPYPSNCYVSPEEFKQIAEHSYVGFNSGGGMFMNRELVLKAGMLLPELRWHSDWLLYFVLALSQGFYYIDEVFIHISMRAAGYSENGKRNNKVQDQVMLDTVKVIASTFPDLWPDFKKVALLPHYSPRYILLFLTDKTARQFVTKRLLWKMLINNRFVERVGRLFPYRVILGMRKLLRS